MDAVGWETAAVWGISEAGPLAMMFAASHPSRVSALLLFGTFARFARAEDYPHGHPIHVAQQRLVSLEEAWGNGELSRSFAPSLVADAAAMRALARLERMAMSPGTARKLFTLSTQLDVRHVLPLIRVPTLILHRTHDQPVRVGHGRYLAEHIANAKYVELAGEDHFAWTGNVDALLSEVREYLTGERTAPDTDRVLTTILFCDKVDSTRRGSRGARPGGRFIDREGPRRRLRHPVRRPRPAHAQGCAGCVGAVRRHAGLADA
jgi:pimeloyl-ACP methyl ester carboxylesterase